MTELYYIPPDDTSFEDMRARAMAVWDGYDDTHGYRSEKQGRIKDLENVEDNFMYIFAMFDQHNQRELVSKLRESTRTELRDRLVAGGSSSYDIRAMGL